MNITAGQRDEHTERRHLKGMLGLKAAPARMAELRSIAEDQGWIEQAKADDHLIVGGASTLHVDRDGEIIHPKAIGRRLAGFLDGSAPFAAAHAHRSDDGLPTQIGWVDQGVVGTTVVACLFRFAGTDTAEQWRRIARDPKGKGLAFSVGFMPHTWSEGTVADLASEMPELKPALEAAGLGDEQRLRVYTDIELIEISAVMAPSNRQSLQLLEAKGLDAPGVAAAIEAAAERASARLADTITAQLTDMQAMLLHELDMRDIGVESDEDGSGAVGAIPDAAADDEPDATNAETDGDIEQLTASLSATAALLRTRDANPNQL